MVDSLFAHFYHFALSVLRLTVWLVLLIAIFVPLERMFTLHPARFWRRQTGIDLAWYFVNSLLPAAIIAFPLSILAQLLNGFDPFGFYSAVGSLPLWIRLILILVVIDVGSYWYHRASHAYPVLWRFHAIHHSAEHIDWLVNTRAHPLDMVLTRLSGMIPVYLLGLAHVSNGQLDKAVVLTVIITTLWSFLIHANVHWRFGPLEWIVSSPAFHHWHHTNDEHRDRNFAAIFPFIDRVFGTMWLPRYWPPVYGIDAKVPESFSAQFTEPLSTEPWPPVNTGTPANKPASVPSASTAPGGSVVPPAQPAHVKNA